MHIPTTTKAVAALLLLAPLVATGAGEKKSDRTVTEALFRELEEAARLADIAYCVGVSGVWRPFGCLSWCGDFEGFELVDTWNTGPLRSDSCGYIALDHAKKRIIIAFRGTYSLASALADLSTTPQVYVPYPDYPPPSASKPRRRGWRRWIPGWIPWFGQGVTTQNTLSPTTDADADAFTAEYKYREEEGDKKPVCTNCTVHAGFLKAWTHTRPLLLPHLAHLGSIIPDYEIQLIGHSLGGAIAALAGLELRAQGVEVVVTTFGEPRVGNGGLVGFLDGVFGLEGEGDGDEEGEREGETRKAFRRVTHKGDPVPLLPLAEWGYAMHGGEIYISSPHLPVEPEDVEICVGDADERCIAGAEEEAALAAVVGGGVRREETGEDVVGDEGWLVPSRLRIWQLLFAHRDYFWRVGLCVPGGDPGGWGRGWYGWLEEEEVGDEL